MSRFAVICALVFLLLFSSAALAKVEPINFNLPTAYDSKIKLSDFRGRVVILDFMASWCKPCLQAIPHLNDLAKKYKHLGLSVIGFDVDEPPSKVRTLIARYKIDFPIVLGTLKEARRFAPIKGLPTTVIIDPEGRVVARYTGRKSKGTFLSAAKNYFSQNPPAEPKFPRKPTYALPRYRGRFGHIWVMDSKKLNNQAGFSFYIELNVADMSALHGLWLELNIQPEAPDFLGNIKPLGDAVKLYKRIDNVGKDRPQAFHKLQCVSRNTLSRLLPDLVQPIGLK